MYLFLQEFIYHQFVGGILSLYVAFGSKLKFGFFFFFWFSNFLKKQSILSADYYIFYYSSE